MSDTVFQKRYQRSAESASEIRVLDSISTGFDVGRGAPIVRASTFDVVSLDRLPDKQVDLKSQRQTRCYRSTRRGG